MKKSILLLFMSFFLILLPLCSCSGAKQTKEPSPTTNTEYSGFSDIPDDYTPKEAEKDGCLVIVNDDESDTEPEVYGEEQWQAFYENSGKAEDAFLRIAHFINNEGYYHDLYHREDKYFQYTKDEYGIRLDGAFKYLRALSGEFGNPRKEVTLYVLTDSLELTSDDVHWFFLSSDTRTRTKIPFVWLGFTTYLNKTTDISSISNDFSSMRTGYNRQTRLGDSRLCENSS